MRVEHVSGGEKEKQKEFDAMATKAVKKELLNDDIKVRGELMSCANWKFL